MGTQFLKHIERACVLAHLIDAIEPGGAGSELNAWQAYQAIRTELENFSQLLRAKKQLVVITKIDALPDPDLLNSVLAPFKEHNLPVLAISSVSGANLDQLIDQLWALAHT